MHKFHRAFTIVELLVVIVIIGILATVVITAFNGISGRAKDASLSSDKAQAKKQIEAFYALNGVYPTANNCTNTAATEICLKTSPGNTLTYTFVSNTATPPYTLTGNSGIQAPAITSVSPSSGPTAGGTSVVIVGTNMTNATAVSFGGTSASSYTVNSATQITAITPSKTAGTVSVEVTTSGGTATSSNAFTYALAPTIASISPTTATAGSSFTLTVNGANFVSGGTQVVVGGSSGSSVSVNGTGTSLTASIPAQSNGAKSVSVTTAYGTAVSATNINFVSPVSVTSVSLDPWSQIVVNGSGFQTGIQGYFRTGPAGYGSDLGYRSPLSTSSTQLVFSHGGYTSGSFFLLNPDGGGTSWISF